MAAVRGPFSARFHTVFCTRFCISRQANRRKSSIPGRVRTCNLRLRRLPHHAETPAKQHVTARENTKNWHRFQGFATGLLQTRFFPRASRFSEESLLAVRAAGCNLAPQTLHSDDGHDGLGPPTPSYTVSQGPLVGTIRNHRRRCLRNSRFPGLQPFVASAPGGACPAGTALSALHFFPWFRLPAGGAS